MSYRIKIEIKGTVQGVGFRPFIYNLAKSIGVKGYVSNTPQGVIIEAEGNSDLLEIFKEKIKKEKPEISYIQSFNVEVLNTKNYKDFIIHQSEIKGIPDALVLPDLATCDKCLQDIFAPENRRYMYPFTNCTNCGPRFSIIKSLPYDRTRTTMKNFKMCPECKAEYENPNDRRFHAQPNACPVCGPHVELWNNAGEVLSKYNEAIFRTVDELKKGKIIAIKGLGGFHLVVDAKNNEAIELLRKRKRRIEKPFALMYPNLESVKYDCDISEHEENLLVSIQSPIVLLKKKKECSVVSEVAPGNPYLGIMLPYTPLHYILMKYINTPVIATSGNIAEEPICINENEALIRLNDIADYFLIHNRPIYRHVDDSIVRIILNEKVLLRRARGYAPLPVYNYINNDKQILATGGHLKNTIAVSKNNNVFISQHIGDLETVESYYCFCNTIEKFKDIYKIKPENIICDLHPDYISTKYAKEKYSDVIYAQHHISHILSVIVENGLNEPFLGIAFDGAGYGEDKTIWGGEFYHFNGKRISRIAHLKNFLLPGGESSFKYIFKSAFGILYELFGEGLIKHFPYNVAENEKNIILNMLSKKVNTPLCSSIGRLFDAVASILNIRQKVRFEGQAAMELEFLTDGIQSVDTYKIILVKKMNDLLVLDWSGMICKILEDLKNNIPATLISVKFHNAIVNAIINLVKLFDEKNVVLSGGCFQNKYLLENSIIKLKQNGYNVYWNKVVPTNDGGISLGQIAYKSFIKK